jgi:hypothetical protein
MTRRRKRQRKARAATAGGALAAIGGVTAAFLLRRRNSGDGEAAAPSTGPAVEDSLRGHSQDAAEAAAPVRPPTSGPVSPDSSPGEPPETAVMPDTSADDPLVQEQTNAAAAQAAAIGGDVDEPGADAASRAVVEGSGDAAETFEAETGEEGPEREKPA